jgi:hypothetical protein
MTVRNTKKTISTSFHKLFWDTDPEKIDVENNAEAIIERIIGFGDIKAISWLFMTYNTGRIVEVLKSSYNISERSIRLWAVALNFNLKDCRCTRRPLLLSRFN